MKHIRKLKLAIVGCVMLVAGLVGIGVKPASATITSCYNAGGYVWWYNYNITHSSRSVNMFTADGVFRGSTSMGFGWKATYANGRYIDHVIDSYGNFQYC